MIFLPVVTCLMAATVSFRRAQAPNAPAPAAAAARGPEAAVNTASSDPQEDSGTSFGRKFRARSLSSSLSRSQDPHSRHQSLGWLLHPTTVGHVYRTGPTCHHIANLSSVVCQSESLETCETFAVYVISFVPGGRTPRDLAYVTRAGCLRHSSIAEALQDVLQVRVTKFTTSLLNWPSIK